LNEIEEPNNDNNEEDERITNYMMELNTIINWGE
jgi:hypothetical protein